jgi:hypothetical protein
MEKTPTRFSIGIKPDCWCRSCLWPGYDKGSFSIGVGYTSYHKTPKFVCMTNHTQGCPQPLPQPDPENGRCCYRPTYKKKGSAPTGWQTCDTCETQVPKWVAKELNALPTLAGVPCRHSELQPEIMQCTFPGWFECSKCLVAGLRTGNPSPKWRWDHRPQPFEAPQFTTEEQMVFLEQRWRSSEPKSE